MKITKLDTIIVQSGTNRTWAFVEVHTDSGLIGVGEASQSRLDAGIIAQVSDLEPLLVGKNPLDIREQLPLLVRQPWVMGRVRHAAVSAIEQALWDLSGKALGVPCYQLLGGKVRDKVRLYANITLATSTKTPEDYAKNAKKAVEQGFTAIKFNSYDSLPAFGLPYSQLEMKEQHKLAVARVKAVREAVGDDIDILTDWVFAVPIADALSASEAVEEFNLFWIEEPFAPRSEQNLAEFRSQMHTRLAGGEQDSGLEPFRRLFEARGVDVAMPDVKWIGGLGHAKKVATMAEAYQIEVAPHNMSGPVSTAASAHLSMNIPNFLILEYCWGTTDWRSDLVNNKEVIVEGHLIVDDTPGLGIDWVRDIAEEHRVHYQIQQPKTKANDKSPY
jgi:galactonate dehydratase